jgi:TonB family protein
MKITTGQLVSALASEVGLASAENKKPTTTWKHVLTVAAILGLAFSHALASGVKVIANPSVELDSISASELKSVFLEEKNSLRGTHVEPVLARGGPAHEAFLRQYVGRTNADLQTYYRSLVFTGRGSMPKALASDAEVVAYVAKTRGAIGYVSPESSADGVRTLAVLGVRNNSDRKLISRIEPEYPEVLRIRSIGGTVRLGVTIAPSGKVTDAEILGGDAVLGQAAVTAVLKWKYAPAPSPTTTEVILTFDPRH